MDQVPVSVVPQTSKQVETVDMNQLNESFKVIVNALNKGCKEGAYNLDESYLIKIALSNVDKSIQLLDKHQKK